MRQRRYPSDMTGAEWALIEPLLPEPACETRAGGRPEKHPRREIVDAIRYVVDTGCKWRALPADFPPWRTVWGFMARWAACGVIGQIRDHLSGRIRREMGKGPRAVATDIDSQSVKAAETVGKDSRGYDAGKKINGRKRHLVVDTRGLPLLVLVTPASLTDRDAAKELLFRLRLMHPEITIVWADSAYAGKLVTWAKKYLNLTIKTVSRPKDASGFIVLPRRWVVERTWAWMMHARRHARDHERLVQHSETLITWAAIILMTRRITRRQSRRPNQPAPLGERGKVGSGRADVG
ncbi:IS5 family transposase [Streptomyces sp. NPDC047515]|uniref:IS5 family transposase n=1 Tax=Streptomyces sp. NPDC047515 TaxID=3155380 RepID=UPI0033C8789D